jgi:hypothetical protein
MDNAVFRLSFWPLIKLAFLVLCGSVSARTNSALACLEVVLRSVRAEALFAYMILR